MRTTLTLDDHLAKELKELAHRTGKPFKAVVNETLRTGLCATDARGPVKRYHLRAVSLGGPIPGVNLTKALALSDALEDEEIVSKMKRETMELEK